MKKNLDKHIFLLWLTMFSIDVNVGLYMYIWFWFTLVFFIADVSSHSSQCERTDGGERPVGRNSIKPSSGVCLGH
jgi:hypothetical protein